MCDATRDGDGGFASLLAVNDSDRVVVCVRAPWSWETPISFVLWLCRGRRPLCAPHLQRLSVTPHHAMSPSDTSSLVAAVKPTGSGVVQVSVGVGDRSEAVCHSAQSHNGAPHHRWSSRTRNACACLLVHSHAYKTCCVLCEIFSLAGARDWRLTATAASRTRRILLAMAMPHHSQ